MEEESPAAAAAVGGGGTINFPRSDGGDSEDITGAVHLMPCCVKMDGPTHVSHYFKPRPSGIVVDGVPVQEAFFRGRKLEGFTLPIPDGYRGYVLEKKKSVGGEGSESSEGGSNRWVSRTEFKSFTYWNHDSVPSTNDLVPQCFHWFSVANALHKPVTNEQLDSMLATQKK